jgi:hypothetical protein
MKRRTALTIVLAVSLISVSLASFDSTARAQQPSRFKGDTGVVSPGPNQILRITVASSGATTREVSVVFKKIEYAPSLCNNEGVCRQVVAAQTTTTPASLAAGEAVSIDIAGHAGGGGVRGVVLANNENIKVTAQTIDLATGNVSNVTVYDNEAG